MLMSVKRSDLDFTRDLSARDDSFGSVAEGTFFTSLRNFVVKLSWSNVDDEDDNDDDDDDDDDDNEEDRMRSLLLRKGLRADRQVAVERNIQIGRSNI